MDFSNRSVQSAAPAPTHTPAAPSAHKRSKHDDDDGKWYSTAKVFFGAAVLVLLVALVIFIGFGGNSNADNENQYVYTNKLQAVFLNTGQVYFGNIKSLNSNYFVLTNIYYLQTSSSSSAKSSTSVQLVKLGCELHAPYDRMVINRDQVTFWENLQSDGQVSKAVSTFAKDNPDGQKCSDQSSSSSTNSGSTVQNATNKQQ
ncbi:MAG TPA: hypothetical protein VG992_02910 [Candidatus Saccharimonadales bacterium]|nr:hypothetical protein [Candidatus Saccharimonadales bacterium]